MSSLRNIPPLPLNAENILEKSLTDVVTHHGLNAHDLKIRNAICMRLKELLKDLGKHNVSHLTYFFVKIVHLVDMI